MKTFERFSNKFNDVSSELLQQLDRNAYVFAFETEPYAIANNYTFSTVDGIDSLQVSASATSRTITLPAPDGNRRRRIINTDSSVNTVTVAVSTAGQLIDGLATYVLYSQYDSVDVEPTGTNWIVVGSGSTMPVVSAVRLWDTDHTNYMTVSLGSNLTANRTLSLVTGDTNRTITLSGSPTLDDWFNQSVKSTASPTFTALTVSALTAGRVTFAGAAGLLADDSDLTFSVDTLTATKFAGALNGTVGATTPSTGAFTTLSATGAISSTVGGEVASFVPVTGTNASYIRFQNTGGAGYIGLDNSTGSAFGDGNYAFNIYSPQDIVFNRSGEKARITLSGLAVTGALSASGDAVFGTGVGTAVGGRISYSGTSGYAGLYPNSLTPSTSNYALLWNAAASVTRVGAVTGGTVGLAVNNVDIAIASSTGLVVTGVLTSSGAFGCNGNAAQTKAVSGGTLAGVISALVANGILSS